MTERKITEEEWLEQMPESFQVLWKAAKQMDEIETKEGVGK